MHGSVTSRRRHGTKMLGLTRNVPTAVARNPLSGDATTPNPSPFWSLRQNHLPPTLTLSLAIALHAATVQQEKYNTCSLAVDYYVCGVKCSLYCTSSFLHPRLLLPLLGLTGCRVPLRVHPARLSAHAAARVASYSSSAASWHLRQAKGVRALRFAKLTQLPCPDQMYLTLSLAQ